MRCMAVWSLRLNLLVQFWVKPVIGETDYYGYFLEVWLQYGPWVGRILIFKERRIMGGSGYDLPDMGGPDLGIEG